MATAIALAGLGLGIASYVSGQHQYAESQAYSAEQMGMAQEQAAAQKEQYLHTLESERAAAQARTRAAGYNAEQAQKDMASTLENRDYALSTYDEMIEDFNVSQRAAIGASGFKFTEGTTAAQILEDTQEAQAGEREQLGREYGDQYEYFKREYLFQKEEAAAAWREEQNITDEIDDNTDPVDPTTGQDEAAATYAEENVPDLTDEYDPRAGGSPSVGMWTYAPGTGEKIVWTEEGWRDVETGSIYVGVENWWANGNYWSG